jgi:hypothetical protein
MDVEFKIEHAKKQEYHVLNIYINNENLIDILKDYEKQFGENNPGKYDGICIYYFDDIDIIKHFMGEADKKNILNYTGKTQILGCTCGEPGCWPFLIKINISGNVIIWNEYEQPFRSKKRCGEKYWNYSNLKALKFNRVEYENKLKNISAEINNIIRNN